MPRVWRRPAGNRDLSRPLHVLLAAEADIDELRRMHGLTVMAYCLQHPSLTKPWFQEYGAEVLRRVFGQGERWPDVLLEAHPRGVGRRQAEAAISRLKSGASPTMPDWVITRPIPGELTVTSVYVGGIGGNTRNQSWRGHGQWPDNAIFAQIARQASPWSHDPTSSAQ